MKRKHQEFMDLKQGGRSVHDYSMLFNHLAQYALDQVDTDDKKKDRIMIGLSTKLQGRMTLNTGGSFPEFVSNVIITDDAIRAHKETKKRLWQLCLIVPLQGTGWCTITASPTRLASISSTSRQYQRLYPHLRLCSACPRYRTLEPPPATPASTMAIRATLHESA
jgi:hypothetical protein